MLAWTALVALPASVQSSGHWSQPATLGACSAPGPPAVLFPSDGPRHPTGPGAIVWGSATGCSGGAGPRLAAIWPHGDVPGAASIPRTAAGRGLGLAGPIAAVSGPNGRILLAGATGPAGGITAAGTAGPSAVHLTETGQGARGGLALSEGPARGPFSQPRPTDGPATPLALTTAYLGDVAVASPSALVGGGGFAAGRGFRGAAGSGRDTAGSGRGAAGSGGKRGLGEANTRGATDTSTSGDTSAIELRVHRYYMPAFLAPVPITAGGGVEGLALALDYRADALAVWERAGAIYARDMPASDRTASAVQRVAAAAPGARIAAVRSDDNRAILAWSETRAGVTSVYTELSATGVTFGGPREPRLLERYADPHGQAPPGGGPRLVRLLSESVMLAWTGAAAGHWVVRTAAVDENGVRAIDTISATGHDAVLAGLAPGPAGEAYALGSEPGPGAGSPDLSDRALYAARGIDAYPGRTIFTSPELISAPGAAGTTGEAAIAVDPGSDRAIATWRTPGGAIDYSLRALGG